MFRLANGSLVVMQGKLNYKCPASGAALIYIPGRTQEYWKVRHVVTSLGCGLISSARDSERIESENRQDKSDVPTTCLTICSPNVLWSMASQDSLSPESDVQLAE